MARKGIEPAELLRELEEAEQTIARQAGLNAKLTEILRQHISAEEVEAIIERWG